MDECVVGVYWLFVGVVVVGVVEWFIWGVLGFKFWCLFVLVRGWVVVRIRSVSSSYILCSSKDVVKLGVVYGGGCWGCYDYVGWDFIVELGWEGVLIVVCE